MSDAAACPAPGVEYLCNAEFDLSLRRAWAGQLSSRYLDEMSCQWITAGGPRDAVCVRRKVPDSFVETLRAAGLEIPTLASEDSCPGDRELAPFGWNRRAIEHNRCHAVPTEHPDLDVVRRANSRSFSTEVEQLVEPSALPAPARASSLFEVQQLVATPSETGKGWVVKADHGNAALANRRVPPGELTGSHRRQIGQWLEEDDTVFVEPWCQRTADLCVTFSLERNGSVTKLAMHETIQTADGGFIGALFDRDAPLLSRHRRALEHAASVAADRLHTIGYFGPVCIDAFTYVADGVERLRPVVDINARRNISLAARRPISRLGPNRCALWRFFSAHRLRLPDVPSRAHLGTAAYDPQSRCGVLVTSPPVTRSPDGVARHASKISVLVLAPDRGGVLELERTFRQQWERR